jgi:hypothetical protein
MIRPLRFTLSLAAAAVLCLAAYGCRGAKSKAPGEGAKAPASAPSPALAQAARPPAPMISTRKDKDGKPLPPDEIDMLLHELCGTELQRARLPEDVRSSWRAEDKLVEIGPSVAPRVRAALSFPCPEARAAACRLAYRFGDAEAIPAMIKLLDDESSLVRLHANRSLCGMTGQDMNYRPEALPEDRAAAKARWEKWYASTAGPVVVPKRP